MVIFDKKDDGNDGSTFTIFIKRTFIYLLVFIISISLGSVFDVYLLDSVIHCDGEDVPGKPDIESNIISKNDSVQLDSSDKKNFFFDSVVDIVNDGLSKTAPILGAGASTSIGMGIFKGNQGAPLATRVAASAVGVATTLTSLSLASNINHGLKSGIDLSIAKQKLEAERIHAKELSDIKIDEIKKVNELEIGHLKNKSNIAIKDESQSGSDFSANCPLESGEMSNPLIDILDKLVYFNLLELFFIFILIWFILNLIFRNKILSILRSCIPSR